TRENHPDACRSLAHQYFGQTKLSHRDRATAGLTIAPPARSNRPPEPGCCRRPETNAPPSSTISRRDAQGRERFSNPRVACLIPLAVKIWPVAKVAAQVSAFPCHPQTAE